jgi:hypothetical protein
MFFGVDHLVFAAARELDPQLVAPLDRAGFVLAPGRLRFDDAGVHSHSHAYVDGAYVELVYPVGPAAPQVWFGANVPRLIGIGVSTDAFDSDTAGWLWTIDEEQRLDEVTTLRIHAAGPHEHLSELYLFAMDRPDRVLDHPGLGGTPELVRLELRGRGHERWRACIESWLGRSDHIGPTELFFADGPHEDVAVSPVFRCGTGAAALVPLAVGAIVLES